MKSCAQRSGVRPTPSALSFRKERRQVSAVQGGYAAGKRDDWSCGKTENCEKRSFVKTELYKG
jgi:hypothetical protein